METIIDRIKYLQRSARLTQAQLARRLSLDPSNLSKVLSGKLPVSQSFINRVVVDMGVSKLWLTDGEGVPYTREEEPRTVDVDPVSTPIIATAECAPSASALPVYDIDVTAGCTELSRMFTDDRISGYIDLPRLNHDCVLVRVSGDSMSPVIEDGSMIAIRAVSNPGIISWGSIYVVVTDDYRFVKYVRRDRDNRDNIILHSANSEYDDIDLPLSEVRSMFIVETVINYRSLN